MELIFALMGIGQDVIGMGIAPARIAYQRAVAAFILVLGVILVGFILNVIGSSFDLPYLQGVNFVLAMVFAGVTSIVKWRPRQLAAVGVAGAIAGALEQGKSMSERARFFLKYYDELFETALLTGTVTFFYLGVVPFGENPGLFFVVVACITVIGIMSNQWTFLQSTLGKEFAFYGACVILCLSVVSLVPTEAWGGSDSFFATWVADIKGRKGGVFLLALLITAQTVFMLRKSDAPEKKKSGYTPIIWILFIIMDTVFMPPAFKQIPGAVSAWWNNDTPSSSSAARQSSHVAPKVVSTQRVLQVTPDSVFQKAEIPQGTKVIEDTTWKCSQGCVLEIEHDKDLLCEDWNGEERIGDRTWHTGFYQGMKCMVTIVDYQNSRYREQFLVPSGPQKFEFPKNLVHVISSVGTNRRLGQVDVISKTTTSN